MWTQLLTAVQATLAVIESTDLDKQALIADRTRIHRSSTEQGNLQLAPQPQHRLRPQPSRLTITDPNAGIRLIVDTGSIISVLKAGKEAAKSPAYQVFVTNVSPIATHGGRTLTLTRPTQVIRWNQHSLAQIDSHNC